MTLTRILGAIGRVLISAGVILLLFVGYELWGTGLHTARAQDSLEEEFEALQDELGASETTVTSTTTTPPGTGTEPTSVPSPDGDPVPADGSVADLPVFEDGQAIGEIDIPAIGSDFFMVEGVDLSYLRDGPGHFPGTSYPGQGGNAALAGHRTTYGAPFHRIDELEPGDEIDVTTLQGSFTYEVMSAGELAETMPFEPEDPEAGHFIITPDDSWILDQYGDNRITLMACHPKYSARQRIVVVGRLVDKAAPTTPPAAESEAEHEALLDEALLGGDSDAWPAVILWALAAASVWFTFWLIGKKWRRWPAYLVGTPIFLVVLFGCFTQVTRLLPAAY